VVSTSPMPAPDASPPVPAGPIAPPENHASQTLRAIRPLGIVAWTPTTRMRDVIRHVLPGAVVPSERRAF